MLNYAKKYKDRYVSDPLSDLRFVLTLLSIPISIIPFKDTATEMLPKIVEDASTPSSIILRLISKYSQQNRREMLFNNFKYIFSYLLRIITEEDRLEKCLAYLQVENSPSVSFKIDF